MHQPKQLQDDIVLLTSLKNLCTSYEEISVIKMRKIRNMVLETRSFYLKLADIYHTVKSSYRDRLQQMVRDHKIKDPALYLAFKRSLSDEVKAPLGFVDSFREKVDSVLHKKPENNVAVEKISSKSVALLISANTKLHGPIIRQVFESYTDYIDKNDTDIIIVGRLGRELYEKRYADNPKKKTNYLYFEIPDMDVRLEDLKSIIYHLIKYEKIVVFYGQYLSMMSQISQFTSITGDLPADNSTDSTNKLEPKVMYLYEPDLEKIVAFFETQIFSNLFEQTVHESHLARLASRITAMEQALERIEDQEKILYNSKRKTLRLIENKVQLERVAGIGLWRGRL